MKTKIKTFLKYLEDETKIKIDSNSIAPLTYMDSNGKKVRQDTVLLGDSPCLMNISSSIEADDNKIVGLNILYGNKKALTEANYMQRKIESVILSIPVLVSFILDMMPVLSDMILDETGDCE